MSVRENGDEEGRGGILLAERASWFQSNLSSGQQEAPRHSLFKGRAGQKDDDKTTSLP